MKVAISVIFMVLIIGLLSCKKQKDETEIYVKIYNPVTDERIQNVEYFIVMRKSAYSDGFELFPKVVDENDTIEHGFSNESGIIHTFITQYKDHDINTYMSFNIENTDIYQEYEKVYPDVIYPLDIYQGKYLFESYKRIIPYIKYRHQIKDTNCSATNDKMRYRVKEVEDINEDQAFSNWSPNINYSTGYYESCYDQFLNNGEPYESKMKYVIVEKEVTRDGQIYTYFDTTLLASKTIDTLKIYY